jgi:hypothetical protein
MWYNAFLQMNFDFGGVLTIVVTCLFVGIVAGYAWCRTRNIDDCMKGK